MPFQQSVSPLEFKLLRKDDKYDLNVILLKALYQLKFMDDNLKTVLGENESLDKAIIVRFENDFINKCFYCGCITEQAGSVISYFIIRKASLFDFYKQIKRQFGSINISKQATIYILQTILNGLQPHECVLIYDDDKDVFIKLSQPVNTGRIKSFIDSFQKCNLFNFLKQKYKPDSLEMLFDAIKRTNMGKNKNIRFYYTLNDDANLQITNNNYEIIFCKKNNRKTYAICSTTPFIQKIKNKFPKGNKYLKQIFDFVGL